MKYYDIDKNSCVLTVYQQKGSSWSHLFDAKIVIMAVLFQSCIESLVWKHGNVLTEARQVNEIISECLMLDKWSRFIHFEQQKRKFNKMCACT